MLDNRVANISNTLQALNFPHRIEHEQKSPTLSHSVVNCFYVVIYFSNPTIALQTTQNCIHLGDYFSKNRNKNKNVRYTFITLHVSFSCLVLVSRYDHEKKANKTVCFLSRGDSFGEEAIMDKVPRDCTVISKEKVELFCISDEVINQQLSCLHCLLLF